MHADSGKEQDCIYFMLLVVSYCWVEEARHRQWLTQIELVDKMFTFTGKKMVVRCLVNTEETEATDFYFLT